MLKFYTILVFVHLLRDIYATDPVTLLDSQVKTDKDAVEALAEIQPHQVLPLILFRQRIFDHGKETIIDRLRLPQTISQAVTVDKRMVKGTKFLDAQMFFCPKQDSEEDCLAPLEFNDGDVLECAKEPLLQINVEQPKDPEEQAKCGTTGIPYQIGYDICPSKDYETEKVPFYGFCFDKNEKNTIYTTHFVSPPSLLNSKLLYWEKRVKYSIVVNDELKPMNLDKITVDNIQEVNSLVHPGKPSYKLQMLVPDEDMALALWRKSTYRNFNLEWQHETLIPIWNNINDKIRAHALKMAEMKIQIMVRTGVINLDSVLEDETQMSNMWVSMITTAPSSQLMSSEGIVIFMNNFIREKKNDDTSKASSNQEKETIDQFCEDDLCLKTLRDEIENVGSRIRCCSLLKINERARNVFSAIKDFEGDEEIRIFDIPDITSE